MNNLREQQLDLLDFDYWRLLSQSIDSLNLILLYLLLHLCFKVVETSDLPEFGDVRVTWAPKSLQTVTAAMKLKDIFSLEQTLWQT